MFEKKIISLEKEISFLEKKLKLMPNGKLMTSCNGKYTKYYISFNHDKKYIHKKDIVLAEQLATKELLELNLNCLNELRLKYIALNQCYIKYQTALDSLLSNKCIHQLLVSNNSLATKDDWMFQPFISNPNYPENLIHTTAFGIKVRSKSEVLIGFVLAELEIPFRYEMKFNNKIAYYPDFTIKFPTSSELFYIEHFGLMDNEFYADESNSKIKFLIKNGILPGKNLICLYETTMHPLTYDYIKQTILSTFGDHLPIQPISG